MKIVYIQIKLYFQSNPMKIEEVINTFYGMPRKVDIVLWLRILFFLSLFIVSRHYFVVLYNITIEIIAI